jgi:hypothetical protein
MIIVAPWMHHSWPSEYPMVDGGGLQFIDLGNYEAEDIRAFQIALSATADDFDQDTVAQGLRWQRDARSVLSKEAHEMANYVARHLAWLEEHSDTKE